MSLKLCSIQRPLANTTSREIDALSACTKANGRPPVAWRQTSPMIPACRNATAVRPGPAAARIRSTPARTRSASASIGSAPGIRSQRSSRNIRRTSGSRRAARMRYSPPSHSPRWTSRSSGTTTGSRPALAASASAVCAVRRSGVTNRASGASEPSRAHTARACSRPSGASGGSLWPSIRSNVSPGDSVAEAPWRTSSTTVASGGGAKGRCG